ncbi:survival of motor neuron-related-splicing factor 30-like [Oscarella lobularis]|uniref:survival of motor neuron-related-splicing factor 30-like n=1 Tax=Oscarella lobularis TaxID=121494 RepID=UPI00331350A7
MSSAEYASNLANHKAQLKQVEAALAADPKNDELLKLKSNIEEVIKLTQDLVQLNSTTPSAAAAASLAQTNEDASSATSAVASTGIWSVGSLCQAVWSKDGQYYDSQITAITGDGTCSVSFAGYDFLERVQLASLRPRREQLGSRKRHAAEEGIKYQHQSKSRAKREAEKEHKKKKALKKAEKMKVIEDELGKEQGRWKSFSGKSVKQKGGFLSSKQKRSIFASPDSVTGRVGVGTCGTGGKEMTQFLKPETYRRENTL